MAKQNQERASMRTIHVLQRTNMTTFKTVLKSKAFIVPALALLLLPTVLVGIPITLITRDVTSLGLLEKLAVFHNLPKTPEMTRTVFLTGCIAYRACNELLLVFMSFRQTKK